MDCHEAAALISARIDGELRAPDEADRLDAHLADCPACREREESFRRQNEALRGAFAPSRRADADFAEHVAVTVPAMARARSKPPLLLVDDELEVIKPLALLLADDFDVVTAESAEAARGLFGRRPIDLILTDQRMPRCNGVQLLEWVYEHHPETVRMLMTGRPEYEDVVSAINRGHIFSFIEKPWEVGRVRGVLRDAAARLGAERERRRREEELDWLASERGRELEEAQTELLQRKRELERLALNDPLTGLLNRRSVEELARFELKRHSRYPTAVALGAIDVDGFIHVNVEHLLEGGDAVLVGLARTLTRSVRETDSVGRVGGEEFLVVARETNEAGAVRLAERIRSTVAGTPVVYQGKPISVTVSVGFAVAEPGVPADFRAMSEAAWEAVYQAKVEGRNRFVVRRLGGAGAG
jgi:diguanylate cyclase (GGDEF)-like protein